MSKVELAGRPEYLLLKRGLYYRPNSQGYTGRKADAGRYFASDARPDCGVSAVHESEAAEYAPYCWPEIKQADLLSAMGQAAAKIEALRDCARELAGFTEHRERCNIKVYGCTRPVACTCGLDEALARFREVGEG